MKTAFFLGETGNTQKLRERLLNLDFQVVTAPTAMTPGMPDLLCLNLYPLSKLSKIALNKEALLELLDATELSMLLFAAKNRSIVVCDQSDLESVIDWLQMGKPVEEEVLDYLAAKAFAAVAEYALAAAELLGNTKNVSGYIENFLVFPEIEQ